MDIDSGHLVLAILAVAVGAVWLMSTSSSRRHKRRSRRERRRHKPHKQHKPHKKPTSTTGTAPLGHAGGGSGDSTSVTVPHVPTPVGSLLGSSAGDLPGIRIQNLTWVSKATGQTTQLAWPDTTTDGTQILLPGLKAGDTLTFQGTGFIFPPTGSTFLSVQLESDTTKGYTVDTTSPGTTTYTFPSNIPPGRYYLVVSAYKYSGGVAVNSSIQLASVS